MNLLEVHHLRTHFQTDEGVVRAVDDVSFSLDAGETLGVVGESGCGKSVTALSLLRLVSDPPGKIVGGSIMLQTNGTMVDVLTLPNAQMRRVRGKRMAMIFQEPMTSLNPLYTIGDQIGEAIALHEGGDRSTIRRRTIEMLELVGMPAAAERVDNYPHQLSGGMRQRTMIAMALSCRPDILIADEPTTALDVTIQAQILELIAELQRTLGMALILITHDLGVVAEVAKRLIVMYAGKIVEAGTVEEVFSAPLHPYTQGLMRAIEPPSHSRRRAPLPTIPGTVPNLARLPGGCAFQDRCPKVQPRCRQAPVPDDPCGVGRTVRCLYAREG